MRTHIRRTALTIEFEQVYRSREARAFLPCDDCGRQNARIALTDAGWLLRCVLDRLEDLSADAQDSAICLCCLCTEILEEKKATLKE